MDIADAMAAVAEVSSSESGYTTWDGAATATADKMARTARRARESPHRNRSKSCGTRGAHDADDAELEDTARSAVSAAAPLSLTRLRRSEHIIAHR